MFFVCYNQVASQFIFALNRLQRHSCTLYFPIKRKL